MCNVNAKTDILEENVLKVLVTGGGPVALVFALLLERLMGNSVKIKMYDSRWMEMEDDSNIIWKTEGQGNARRQQVVTLQSRQYLRLPQDIQDRIFREGYYTEMWPIGPDSINEYAPRNVRIAHIENELLSMANKKANIELIPELFEAATQKERIKEHHILAICEGGGSQTRKHFLNKFGKPDESMYSLNGEHLTDVVLGLKVKSDLPDSMAVLLTVVQNRFLLNSLQGEGFLNVRLTDEEIGEVRGLNLDEGKVMECIQKNPCLMQGTAEGFKCATHGTLFIPALLKDNSALWRRIYEGLKLFGVREENLSAVTAFRLNMVQRPRFTAQLFPETKTTPGTFGCLLGDAANAIHFWPGRGLNSGIASAISLARCVHDRWNSQPFRDADFFRHEGLMSMLQYRHKSRAWRAMVENDGQGPIRSIKNKIEHGIMEGELGTVDKSTDIDELINRLSRIRNRLKPRLSGLPSDTKLREHLKKVDGATLRTLVVSGSWNTSGMGGEEVDVNLLLEEPNWPAELELEDDDIQPIITSDSNLSTQARYLFNWVNIPDGNFWISKYPVTNKIYKQFLDATEHIVPDHWDNGNIPEELEEHPVVNVNWYDAQAFCTWASVVLLTDSEWEKAARGPYNSRYPLQGEKSPNHELCNFQNHVGSTTPVDHYPDGTSEYGVQGMAGNVFEWTAESNDQFLEPEDMSIDNSPRSIRGGCFSSPRQELFCSDRIKMAKNEKRSTIGFRVAIHKNPDAS